MVRLMISLSQAFLRILVALFLGGLIGWERETHDRPAGFRTHILVAVGSALLMLVSINMAGSFPESNVDPGRIAAQVVSGIGFLGAGTIIREGISVKGLTTAASLWSVAAIGLATGGGYYYIALITTLIVFVTLYFFSRIELSIEGTQRRKLVCRVMDKPGILGKIGVTFGEENISIRNVHLNRDVDKGEILIKLEVNLPRGFETVIINQKLLELEEMLEIDWSS